MQKKNLASTVAAIALAAGIALLSLTGCQPTSCSGPAGIGIGTSASPAKSLVDDGFKAITDTSAENLNARLGSTTVQRLQELGFEPADVYKAFFDKMTYEVGDAVMNEDDGTGTVKVKVTNIDVLQVLNAYQNEFAEWAASSEATELLTTEGMDGLNKRAIEVMLEKLGDAEAPTTTTDLVVDLTRDADGNWQLANPDGLAYGALGGLDLSTLF